MTLGIFFSPIVFLLNSPSLSQLPPKRLVQQRLKQMLCLALGFSLLGAETFSSVYVLMLIALECS
jgi:hypothetical protein